MVASSQPRVYCTAASIFPSSPPSSLRFSIHFFSDNPSFRSARRLLANRFLQPQWHLLRHPLCQPEHALFKGSLCDATLWNVCSFLTGMRHSGGERYFIKRSFPAFCAVSGARPVLRLSWLLLLLRLLPDATLQFCGQAQLLLERRSPLRTSPP